MCAMSSSSLAAGHGDSAVLRSCPLPADPRGCRPFMCCESGCQEIGAAGVISGEPGQELGEKRCVLHEQKAESGLGSKGML